MTASARTVGTVMLAMAVWLASPEPAAAQTSEESSESSAPDRDYTVLAGVGNDMGWFGAQAEKYFEGGRLSIFGGLGYTPGDRGDDLDNTGVTGAVGVRGYTGGDHHRGLLEFSVSQLVQEDLVRRNARGRLVQEGGRRYGPGLAVGYQYVAGSGFTAMVSGGFGVAIGVEDRIDTSHLSSIVNLGLGITF